MRIGFDVDGVFADFNKSFVERVVKETGRDLFGERPYVPTTWDYPETHGYTKEEVSAVWNAIINDPNFWLRLEPFGDETFTSLKQIMDLDQDLKHDIYFISSRPGVKSKFQTETWIATHASDFTWRPTVLISSEKGACAKALKLDVYIDDYRKNIEEVRLLSPTTRLYLLDQPWNQLPLLGSVRRVTSIEEMLKVEVLL